MLTRSLIAPDPLAVLPLAPLVAVLVHETPVREAGKLSETRAPTALLGPLFVTTIV
jgi:hypothetical protein